MLHKKEKNINVEINLFITYQSSPPKILRYLNTTMDIPLPSILTTCNYSNCLNNISRNYTILSEHKQDLFSRHSVEQHLLGHEIDTRSILVAQSAFL